MKELVIKKCSKCGATIKIFEDCNCEKCGIKCCDEEMRELLPNIVDASREKHIPTYVVEDNKIIVSVNHVMEDNHYIEWICLLSNDREEFVYFKPGDTPKATFLNVDKGIIYSYCNKHELWKIEIK